MSTPQSTIYVCSGVRLDSRYDHSIYFGSKSAQEEYFAGKVVRTFSAYSYLRKSWPLEVQASMEDAKTWSYLFFRNGTGKTYYYFINNVEYKNNGSIVLSLELDVIQTYLFDFDLLDCFIERQHTTTDGIGEHTVDEGLDVGELTCKGWNAIDPGALAIMVMCTTNPNATTEEQAVPALPYMYNRVFSGVKIWAIDASRWSSWGSQLDVLDSIGQTDSIQAMWMYPKQLIKLGGESAWTGGALALPVESARSQEDSSLVYSFNKATGDVDGYTPKNKKLLTYPYNFAYCTNNEGTSAVYRYERFEGDEMNFVLSGSLTPGGGVHMTPMNYNGIQYNYHEGMNINSYPTCAWDSDIYKLWLAQNQGQLATSAVTAGLKIVGGIASAVVGAGVTATGVGAVVGAGGVAGGVATAVSGAQQIMGMLAQNHDKDIVPPQAKGSFSSSVNITNNMQAFTFYHKSVTAERARILDDFFTMYGYCLNRVQKPNIHARKAYTYIKTVGCKILGRMCTEDIVKIESIFDKGLTFWVNGDKVADYSQDNTL